MTEQTQSTTEDNTDDTNNQKTTAYYKHTEEYGDMYAAELPDKTMITVYPDDEQISISFPKERFAASFRLQIEDDNHQYINVGFTNAELRSVMKALTLASKEKMRRDAAKQDDQNQGEDSG